MEMKHFKSKNVKGSFFGFKFCVYSGHHASGQKQKDLERPFTAGRKSEGLNSATYEIVALGYMKKTRGEIE